MNTGNIVSMVLFKRYASRLSTNGSVIKKSSFDKTFDRVVSKKVKPWERDGITDKDTWFKKKYAHVHVKQKQREAHLEQVKKQRDEQKRERLIHKQKFDKPVIPTAFQKNHSTVPFIEYVYGTNCVIAALSNKNRNQFYRLLCSNDSVIKEDEHLSQLVKDRNIKVVPSSKHDLNLLTKNAVHNGIVLETKPLDPIEITHLGPVNIENTSFQIHKYASEFDVNTISGYIIHQSYLVKQSTSKQYPLGIYLDEVSDTHNLGAIIRTAFYLGVDFIVISRRNCAKLSPVVNKCSSGAMEYIPIFMVDKPLTFFDKSQEQGQWTFITSHIEKNNRNYSTSKLNLSDMHGLLNHGPVMLVVGNEGSGVRTNLQLKSDFTVHIPYIGPNETPNTVDSLNVSVATAILLFNLLS